MGRRQQLPLYRLQEYWRCVEMWASFLRGSISLSWRIVQLLRLWDVARVLWHHRRGIIERASKARGRERSISQATLVAIWYTKRFLSHNPGIVAHRFLVSSYRVQKVLQCTFKYTEIGTCSSSMCILFFSLITENKNSALILHNRICLAKLHPMLSAQEFLCCDLFNLFFKSLRPGKAPPPPYLIFLARSFVTNLYGDFENSTVLLK